MAKKNRMGKKNYTSKGERPNVKRSTRTAMRREYTGTVAEMNNKVDAWRAGKRVMLTIPNPEVVGDNPTNKPFIRVEAKQVWGDPNPPKKKAKTPA